MRKFIRDRSFYAVLLTIAVPIALKELINFGVSMMDTLMLGRISDIQIAACSQANQPQFIFTLFNFGLAGGGCVLAAQYWGKKDTETIRKIIGILLRINIIVSVILTIIVQLFPEQIMRIYINSSEANGNLIISEAVAYLRIVSFGYIIFGLTMTFQNSIRSVEIVNISTISSIISFAVNVFLNWVLIFGNLGFEPMGIRGAAIATLVSRIVDFCITVVFAFRFDKKLLFKPLYLLTRDKQLYHDLIKISLPVVANELMWGLAISCQSAILGQLDTKILAPVSIASTLQQMSTIVIMAVSNAAGVIIGKRIGQKDIDGAKDSALTFTVLSVVMGIFSALLVLLLRKPFTMIYNIDAATMQRTQQLLIITAVLVFFVSVNSVAIVGILRGAGDTKYSLKLELVCLWLIALPCGLIAGFIFNIPALFVYGILKIDEPIKAVFATIRTFKDSTFKDVTR